jgi:hypothetical protein
MAEVDCETKMSTNSGLERFLLRRSVSDLNKS